MSLRNATSRNLPTSVPILEQLPSAPPDGGLEPGSQQELTRGLTSVLNHLKGDPAVAYVLASLRKGLAQAGARDLPPEEKEALIQKVKEVLLQSPSVLQALAEYTGQNR